MFTVDMTEFSPGGAFSDVQMTWQKPWLLDDVSSSPAGGSVMPSFQLRISFECWDVLVRKEWRPIADAAP